MTTETVLVDAVRRAIADAGLRTADVDGFAMTSFTAAPDHAIDIAWRAALKLRWIMDDATGGASGLNMLQHAVRAIAAEDAEVVVIVGGDRLLAREVRSVQDGYNKATRDHLTPIPFDGPNTQFALLTQQHMAEYGLLREDYGHVAIAQRRWAAGNPNAAYRRPLTMEEYLAAPVVAPPLGRYDCPPIVTGADAIVVARADRAPAGAGVRVRALGATFNADHQEADRLSTGLAEVAPRLWRDAGMTAADVDLVCIYDDYPVVLLTAAADLGLIDDGDVQRFVRVRLAERRMPLNTSGGLLSAGQAGGGSGVHPLVEAVVQLRGLAGSRQVGAARTALVSGYGMVLYRYGACANAVVLEGPA